MNRLSRHGRILAAAPLVFVLAATACSPESTAPVVPTQSIVIGFPPGDGVPTRTEAEICKDGSSATIEIVTHFLVGGTQTDTAAINAGECLIVLTSSAVPKPDTLFITEIGMPTGVQLDSIVTLQGVTPNTQTPMTITRTVQASGTSKILAGLEWGATVYFYNSLIPPPPPGGGEGCTPGYWKQTHHFDSWPAAYSPDQLFSTVFEDAFPGKTLVEVLSTGGGGLDALGRHAVAALLNAGSTGVSYDFTTADVINGFNGVFPGTKNAYNTQKDIFEGFNEQGCPLN
ncbi:MAG: hypothetical protein SF070_17055 [Gemmatimonadota bacterium]|nr:hypothetical protein [Gemmatimonadota bacterium]